MSGSLTMAVKEQKAQEFSSHSGLKAACLGWFSVYSAIPNTQSLIPAKE